MSTVMLSAQQRYRANHPERVAESSKRWRTNNQDKARESARLSSQKWISNPINRMKHILDQAARRAVVGGREFTITIDDLLPLPECCPVLGVQLNYQGTKQRGFVDDSPSIDRIDASKGYVKGNVRVICWRANRIKADASIEELEAVLRYMKEHTCPQ